MAARLCKGELDAQTYDVGDNEHRQHLQETEPEGIETHLANLVADIVHTKEQCGEQRHDDHTHRTLHVVAVADVSASLCRCVRNKEEGLERIESR